MPAVPTSSASRPHLISVAEMTAPCLRLDVDISEELPSVPGGRSRCAWILVRALGNPLGAALISVPEPGVTSAELGELLVSALGNDLRRLLLADATIEPGADLTLPLRLGAGVPRGTLQGSLPAPAPAITVVVCTAHRGDGLRACLESLSRLEYPEFSILVVDNQPGGAAVGRLVEEIAANGLSIRLVAEPRRGLAWARNRALAEADSEWTAWIDDDETADPHWLTEIARALTPTPVAAAVAGLMVPAELETPAQLLFEQYGGHSKHRGFRPVIFSPGHPQSPLYPLPPFGTGGNMALRRSAVRQVGEFDTALGAGTLTRAGEDTKMFTDLLLAGETVIYQPSAVTYHTHRRTMGELGAQVMGYGSGLTAYYTAELLDRPALALSLGKLIPKFIREAISPSNLRTAGLPAQFPSRLLWANRIGLVSGPGRYLLARAIARRVGRRQARLVSG